MQTIHCTDITNIIIICMFTAPFWSDDIFVIFGHGIINCVNKYIKKLQYNACCDIVTSNGMIWFGSFNSIKSNKQKHLIKTFQKEHTHNNQQQS